MAQMDDFKPYNQGQTMLLPLSLEEFVPADHKARIISAIVDKMDLSCLYSSFCTDNGQDATFIHYVPGHASSNTPR